MRKVRPSEREAADENNEFNGSPCTMVLINSRDLTGSHGSHQMTSLILKTEPELRQDGIGVSCRDSPHCTFPSAGHSSGSMCRCLDFWAEKVGGVLFALLWCGWLAGNHAGGDLTCTHRASKESWPLLRLWWRRRRSRSSGSRGHKS